MLACFRKRIEAAGIVVAEGVFEAPMDVESINDGPVTLLLGSKESPASWG